MAITAVPRSML